MFTRVAFCESCFNKQLPQDGTFFILFGHSTQNYHKHRVDKHVHAKEYGFTPHLMNVISTANGIVKIEMVCSIVGCGLYLGTPDSNKDREVIFTRTMFTDIPEEEFKALYQFKNTGYEI